MSHGFDYQNRLDFFMKFIDLIIILFTVLVFPKIIHQSFYCVWNTSKILMNNFLNLDS